MSGSKNCPETPRQKMIGMMYLVLTAMLALQVSTDVLNGFTMVDKGLRSSIASSEQRNAGMYRNFEEEAQKDPQKVGEWLQKAKQVKVLSDNLNKYISDYKYQLALLADGKDADKNALDLKDKENTDAAGEYSMIKGNGKILQKKLDDYRKALIAITGGDPAKTAMFNGMFSTEKKDGKPWMDAMFEKMPVAAVIANLSRYQSDVRSAEAATVEYLRAKADLQDYNFNTLEVIVNAESSYVLQGSTYNATIYLAAFDKNKVNTYQYGVNGGSLGNSNKISFGASGVGPHTFTASVRVPKNDGTWETYTSDPYEYMVGKPSATISNVDLNVVYRGIDNRFKISVPGVPQSNVRISGSGASVTQSGDLYIVRPNQDGEISLNVSAMIGGKMVNMGSERYRVKYLPDPKSFLQYNDGGIPRLVQEGRLSKRLLTGGGLQVIASYGDDVLIKANFTVKSFTLVTLMGSIPSSGSTFNSRQQADIRDLEGGDLMIIKNIKAVGPDGKLRTLTPITIEI